MMKNQVLALCLVMALLLCLTSCQKDPADQKTPQTTITQPSEQSAENIIPGIGTLDGSGYSVRVLDAPAMYIYQIFGLSDGWVNIYGEYNEQLGFFYVNEKGEILNDTVYSFGYSFDNGTAYVTLDDEIWYCIDTAGSVLDEYSENPYSHPSGLSRDMTTVNGEERWFVTYNGEAITEPIFEWISGIGYDSDYYAVLAEGEHRNVLINEDGEVTVVLPDDCTFADQGENGIIGYFADDDGQSSFRLLGNDGTALSDYRYDALTHISNWLAVGVQDDRLMLLDELGVPMMTFDIPLKEDIQSDLTAVAFDNDLIAAIGAEHELVLLRVEFEEMPLRRRALDMVEKSQELFFFYLGGDTDYDVDYANPTQGVDWLYEGTTATYLGKPLVLTGDYKRFEGELMGKKVNSLDSLRQAVEMVLTSEAAEKHYFNKEDSSPYFVEYKGYLFRVAADGGYLPGLDRGSVKILYQSADVVEFTIDDFYHNKGDGDTYYFQMVKTEDGWRLDTAFPGEDYPRS